MSDILAAASTLAADANGNTALHRCTTPEEAEELIRLRLDVEAKNVCGSSPLCTACDWGNLKVAQVLIAAGADVNICNSRGMTPLYNACRYGHLGLAQALIVAGADVNTRNRGGWSMLHYTCRHGLLALAQALITAGADVNARNSAGLTPRDLCKTKEMKALFAPEEKKRPGPPKNLIASLKTLVAEYE